MLQSAVELRGVHAKTNTLEIGKELLQGQRTVVSIDFMHLRDLHKVKPKGDPKSFSCLHVERVPFSKSKCVP